MNVKLLDCTLRDGGYLNDWLFGQERIALISQYISDANIEYIENGFLSDKIKVTPEKSLYSQTSIPKVNDNRCHTLMVNFGECDFSNLLVCD